MAIRREDWKWAFTRPDLPHWLCPRCNSGQLRIAEGNQGEILHGVDSHDTASSRLTDRSPLGDEGYFSGMLRCSRSECAESVAVCGEWFTVQEFDQHGHEYLVTRFQPHYFFPAVRIFQPPAKCPEVISNELQAAFAVYWCDTAACLNHIRTAIEHLLTKLGVSRFTKVKKRLVLNTRINMLPAKYSDLSKALHALRWLGNFGSHGGRQKLAKDDALDGFELLEHVLEERYDPRSKKVGAITRDIIKRKGPRRRPTP